MKYDTEQIKQRVPLGEAVERYTGERIIKNKMRCPFHNEKTASFTIYRNNTFYCFGCSAHGDVIAFVQRYFNIKFFEAVKRLDFDYNLGLTEQLTYAEYRRQQREVLEQEAERRRHQETAQRVNDEYWHAFDKVIEYERIIEHKAPRSPDDEPSEEFIKALQNIEYARHLLDCAENKRREKCAGKQKR